MISMQGPRSLSEDAALGRWFGTDPQDQFASPYVAMGNNPVMGIDPDGECPIFIPILVGAAISAFSYSAGVALSPGGFNNWNWGQFGKSLAIGAVSGVFSAGIGNAFGRVGSQGIFGELGRSAVHGLSNMMVNGAFSSEGKVSMSNFLAGSVSSLIGSGTHNLSSAVQLGSSALAGGISSEITGGDFWTCFAIGGTVAGLNHLRHRLQDGFIKTGKYEKRGRLIGVHRVVKQQDGYTTYADQKRTWFTLAPNGELVTKPCMFSYFPGGESFANTEMGQSKFGIYIREHLSNHLDNVIWLFGPKMPYGTMPGQPYL